MPQTARGSGRRRAAGRLPQTGRRRCAAPCPRRPALPRPRGLHHPPQKPKCLLCCGPKGFSAPPSSPRAGRWTPGGGVEGHAREPVLRHAGGTHARQLLTAPAILEAHLGGSLLLPLDPGAAPAAGLDHHRCQLVPFYMATLPVVWTGGVSGARPGRPVRGTLWMEAMDSGGAVRGCCGPAQQDRPGQTRRTHSREPGGTRSTGTEQGAGG